MQQLGELKPNTKRLYMISAFKVIGVALAIILIVIYLNNSMGGFDGMYETFEEMGAPPMDFSNAMMWFIIAVSTVAAFILILNYLSLGKARYVFYNDRLVCYNSFLIISTNEEQVPYSNITKVYIDKNKKDIKFELTGMKKQSITLESIDDAEKVITQIQNIINRYRSDYYAQYSQNYRLKSIAERTY